MKVKLSDSIPVNIYELRDPRDITKSPRYVGITIKDLDKRLLGHLGSLKSKTHKNHWIKSLLKDGICPTIHLIEEVIGWDYACKVEQYWIKEFREQGYNLTNSTDGGEGSLGIIAREDTREKHRQNNLGSKNAMYGMSGELSPAWGRHHTEDEKKRTSESHRRNHLEKEFDSSIGLEYDSKRNTWISTIWLFDKKLNIGTYSNKENAIEVRKDIFNKRKNNPLITYDEIKLIIEKYTRIEWCKKLLKSEPQVNFKTQRGKWVARLSTNPGRKHLGLFVYKEDAIKAYQEAVNQEIIKVSRLYNIIINN